MADNRTTELLPCPFCGSEADVAEMTTKCDGMEFFKISCNDCFCPGANIHMWYKTEAEAITAWNTRASEQSEQIVIEEPDTIRNEFEDNGLLVDDEAEQDTREKLEADVSKYVHDAWAQGWEAGQHDDMDCCNFYVSDMRSLLDRQAAITRREFIHSHPVCGRSDTCHATNLLNSESVERETPQTAENVTSKDEIRDFDVWSVAYGIYCAGGWVDNGNEPNPPTDGIWKLLDRQAAITRREVLCQPDERDELNATNGTLTAELVRKVLLLHLPHREYYSVEQTDAWQAIADELNGELGSGTCELTAFADVSFNVDYEIEGYDSSSGNDYAVLAECSKCGAFVIIPPAYHHVLTYDGDEVYQPYRYCPNCGCKVVDA